MPELNPPPSAGPPSTFDVTVADSSTYDSFAVSFGNPAGAGGVTNYTYAPLPTLSSVTASVSDEAMKLSIVQGAADLYQSYEVSTDGEATWSFVMPTKISDYNFEVTISGLTNLQHYSTFLRATNSDDWVSGAYNVGSVTPSETLAAITITNVVRHQLSNTMEIFFEPLNLSQALPPSTLSVTYTLAGGSEETKIYFVTDYNQTTGTVTVALQ